MLSFINTFKTNLNAQQRYLSLISRQMFTVTHKGEKMTTQNKITFRVIDAPTGAGKTTALIKMINAAQTSADSFNR